jgi:NADPH-dependent curcumin reductase CurA
MNAGSEIQVQATTVNRQWVLAERPVDRAVRETDFRLVESPLPVPGDGEFLIRTLYLSLAPVMRLYMLDGAGIERPLGIGEVMRGRPLEDVLEGFEQMPRALMRLYDGLNVGKQIVRVK